MKNYTPEVREEALEALPKPVSGFLCSRTISAIYAGIAKKLKLNLRQEGLMSQIANVTLLGLEPEHALETNIHQWLPELSNANARELTADINDRIFKEAQRRLRENVLEPESEWDEVELGPKPTKEDLQRYKEQEKFEREHPLSDEELRKIVAQEIKEKEEKEAAEEAEAAKTRPVMPAENKIELEKIEIPIEIERSTQSVVAEKLGGVVGGKPVEEVLNTEPGTTSSEFQVQSPESGATSSESRVQSPELITKNSELGTQNIPAPLPLPVKPTEQVVTPPPLPPAAEVKKYPDKVDPYREPIE